MAEPFQKAEVRERQWDSFLRACPRCESCGDEITELPYLQFENLTLCMRCVCRFTVDTEAI